MDRKKENDQSFFDGVRDSIREKTVRRRADPMLLISDIAVFVISFVFARCAMPFATYPLGIAFIAMLKSGVFTSLFGAFLGAMTLGKDGIIYGVIYVITVFLRVIVSGGKSGADKLFSESLTLRVCSAGIGALVSGIYRVLLDGFSSGSLLFAGVGIALCTLFTVVFSGIYLTGISVKSMIYSKDAVLSKRNFKTERERMELILFQIALLTFAFLIGYSISSYDFLGVSPCYVYSAFLTLFTARRFGSVRAMCVGFVSAIPLSGTYAVSFALAGAGAGALFAFGIPYAVICGGILLTLYSYYVGGMNGIVSTFPEFMCAALLAIPFLRKIDKEKSEETAIKENGVAERMVNIAALNFKNKSATAAQQESVDTIRSMSAAVKNAGMNEGKVSYEEYRDAVVHEVREHCLGCPSYEACIVESPAPCVENIDLIAGKMAKGERIFVDDIDLFPKYCEDKDALFDRIVKSGEHLDETARKNRRMEMRARDYELISGIVKENFDAAGENARYNAEDSERGLRVAKDMSIGEPSVKVFGTRKRHIVVAGADDGGKISTSKEFRSALEKAYGARLSDGEYYKKDNFILSEFDELEKYECRFSYATSVKCGESVSGDSVISFRGDEGRFYALIADGEGSGEEAREISSIACDFLSRVLKSASGRATAIKTLNQMLRFREREKSTTVDLFELDLYTGEGVFYKCGAVSSYIKRDGSIFRVRSQSAPLGLIGGIDAERVRVDIKHGDVIVMLSDGACSDSDEGTWLLEHINKTDTEDVKEYAASILKRAKDKTGNVDDMTVAVIKVGLI